MTISQTPKDIFDLDRTFGLVSKADYDPRRALQFHLRNTSQMLDKIPALHPDFSATRLSLRNIAQAVRMDDFDMTHPDKALNPADVKILDATLGADEKTPEGASRLFWFTRQARLRFAESCLALMNNKQTSQDDAIETASALTNGITFVLDSHGEFAATDTQAARARQIRDGLGKWAKANKIPAPQLRF